MEKKSIKQLVTYLESNATEEELLGLCLDVEDRILLEKNRQKDLTGFLERTSLNGKCPPKKGLSTPVAVKVSTIPAVMVGEGLKATSDAVVKRIRKDVALRIISHLKNGPDKPTTLANMLNISTGKMSGIISALTSRGDVLFDGKVVSLPPKST